jgi:hypothetical protein
MPDRGNDWGRKNVRGDTYFYFNHLALEIYSLQGQQFYSLDYSTFFSSK